MDKALFSKANIVHMERVIIFDRVVKNYGNTCALKDLTFSINRGESVAMVGNNGCGKTSTINLLCNLISYDSGEASIFGRQIMPLYVSYKNRIGVILSPPVFVNEFTVYEYLKFIGKFQKVPQASLSERAEELAEILEITNYRKARICDYSAGSKMRIAFAASLIHNPEILIFDEPFVHMDIQATDIALNLLTTFKEKKTILVTSNNIEVVLNLCDRVLVMDHGTILEDLNNKDISLRYNISQAIKGRLSRKDNKRQLSWLE